jgi:hypothetical protein
MMYIRDVLAFAKSTANAKKVLKFSLLWCIFWAFGIFLRIDIEARDPLKRRTGRIAFVSYY